MQIDVRQNRGYDSALRRPLPGVVHLAFFHVPVSQKTAHQPDKVRIADAVFQKLHHPAMIDMIEKPFDVGINDVVDRLCHDDLV